MPFSYWSLTAALTPGGHHVRLYLETEGKITTLLSKKDKFDEFWTGEVGPDGARSCIPPESLKGPQPGGCGTERPNDGSGGASAPAQCGNSDTCSTDIAPLNFLAADGLLLTDVRPRDPNVSVSDLGVYVMTWDNRPATKDYGPSGTVDSVAVSDTFGLAFSVDGLNWTVYSNEMKIEGELPVTYNTAQCFTQPTGKLRHVVPIFLANDQIRIYFTSEIARGGPYGGGGKCGDTMSTSCSLGTAVSN